ncbi:MAG TPA: hypothetical protein EYP63_00765 [Desulfotomaculum sp.]|nr:hypothetical protein [Desulfotomaculum sp.]
MALRIYRTNLTAEHLGQAIKIWFGRREFDTQLLADQKTVLVQAKKGGTLATVAGMSYALTVRLKQREDGVELETGAGKWLDKAAAGTVGWLAFFPLAITAGIGFYNQGKLVDELLTFLEHYVAEVSG